MEKNKRNKIIGLSIGIIIVLIIIVSSTYAYWQITRTQETPNDIVAACLNLDLADASAAIDLDSAWPISDEEGKNLTGYTFTVTNNCDEEINYIVGLNRVEEENYLQDSSIKLQLDDNSSFVYGELSDVEYVDAENTEYTARVSKQVSVETIGASATNTHTIRIWVSDEAPVEEQSKTFLGQVFITGGQGIEVPECFTIANDGTILGYDESCGTEVKVPAEINGIQVKEVNFWSFRMYDVGMAYTSKEGPTMMLFILNNDVKDKAIDFVQQMMCEDVNNCDLDNIGVTIVDGLEEYNNHDFSQYSNLWPVIVMNYDELNDTFIMKGGDGPKTHNITSLDLSEAVYLEKIGEMTLGGTTSVNEGDCTGKIIVEDTSNGDYCIGDLRKLILPQNGKLKQIGLSEEESMYGHGAFEHNQLEEIIIPSTVEYIEYNAFSNNKITNLNLSDGLVTIGRSAFEQNLLTNIKIPFSVESIGERAFYSNQISSLTFEGTNDNTSLLKTIEGRAFAYNNLSKIVIPNSVTTIGGWGFGSNANLTEVIIKNTEGNIIFEGYGAGWQNATITYNPDYIE